MESDWKRINCQSKDNKLYFPERTRRVEVCIIQQSKWHGQNTRTNGPGWWLVRPTRRRRRKAETSLDCPNQFDKFVINWPKWILMDVVFVPLPATYSQPVLAPLNSEYHPSTCLFLSTTNTQGSITRNGIVGDRRTDVGFLVNFKVSCHHCYKSQDDDFAELAKDTSALPLNPFLQSPISFSATSEVQSPPTGRPGIFKCPGRMDVPGKTAWA